jgi:hypothetical protein
MIRAKREKVLEEYSKQNDNKDPLFELQKKDYKPNSNADWKIAYDNPGVAKIITPTSEEVARLRDERLKENNRNHATAAQIAREARLARQEEDLSKLKKAIERKIAEGNARHQQANKPVFKDGLFNRIRFKK